jgi:hypothetical protein
MTVFTPNMLDVAHNPKVAGSNPATAIAAVDVVFPAPRRLRLRPLTAFHGSIFGSIRPKKERFRTKALTEKLAW